MSQCSEEAVAYPVWGISPIWACFRRQAMMVALVRCARQRLIRIRCDQGWGSRTVEAVKNATSGSRHLVRGYWCRAAMVVKIQWSEADGQRSAAIVQRPAISARGACWTVTSSP